jgi:hypothetical protein
MRPFLDYFARSNLLPWTGVAASDDSWSSPDEE